MEGAAAPDCGGAMILRIYLIDDELRQWRDPEGRERIIERCRQIATGDMIDEVRIHYGNQGDVLELAPTSHEKLAARLRQLHLHGLADLLDEKRTPDVVERQKFADQLQALASNFAIKDPIGEPHS